MPNMDPKKCPMPSQEPNVRNKNFKEVALGYTEEMAVNEAKRCLQCKNHPCRSGCPVEIDTHIQNIAPGPPIRRAVATPTILPVPISAASVVQSVANGDTSPAPSSFSKILFSALGNLHICIPRNLYVKYRPVPIRSTNVGGPQTNV